MDIKKIFTFKRIIAIIAVITSLVALGYRMFGTEEDAKKVEKVGSSIQDGASKLKEAE